VVIKISIEHIQKINNLVQELLKKGVAETREDAVRMAESYLNKKIVSEQQKKTETNDKAPEKDIDYYMNIFERTKDYMQKELRNFRQALEAIAKEIGHLKKEISDLKTRGEARSAKNSELDGKNVKEAAGQKKLAEEKDKEFHPKQGRFNPNDVSVEKMFYYGNK
jgi:hypothetical protein